MFEQLKEFVVTLRGEVDKPSTDGLVKTVDDLSGKVMAFATAAARCSRCRRFGHCHPQHSRPL